MQEAVKPSIDNHDTKTERNDKSKSKKRDHKPEVIKI